MPPIIYIIILIPIIVFIGVYFQNKRNRFLSVKKLEELKKKDDPESKEALSKLCPVCGFEFFKQFGFKAWDGDLDSQEICPGCGMHFGYYDAAGGSAKDRIKCHDAWRKRFLKKGMTSKPIIYD